jgi:hypothetical protein
MVIARTTGGERLACLVCGVAGVAFAKSGITFGTWLVLGGTSLDEPGGATVGRRTFAVGCA